MGQPWCRSMMIPYSRWRSAAVIDGCTVAFPHCWSTSPPSSAMAVSVIDQALWVCCLSACFSDHCALSSHSDLFSGSLERFTSGSMSPSTLNYINLLDGVREEKGVRRAAERRWKGRKLLLHRGLSLSPSKHGWGREGTPENGSGNDLGCLWEKGKVETYPQSGEHGNLHTVNGWFTEINSHLW